MYYIDLIMKKIVFAVVVCLSIVFSGCKDKTVTTTYTIGCLGYQTGAMSGSDWETLQSYFSSQVMYNKTITFENKTLAENDSEAEQLYNAQVAKLDKDYVCSLIADPDFFIYGIAKKVEDGSYRYIGAIKFTESGATEEVQ